MARGPYALIILLFAALAALGQFSTNIYISSLPEIENDLAATKQLTQLSVTVFLAVFAFCQLFYGPVSDRYGRIRIIIGGTIIYILGSLVCALATDITALICGRAVQAMGAAAGVIVGRALLRDLYSGKKLDQTISTMNAVFAIVPAVSPVVGAWLAGQINWRADFWAAVILGVIVIPWLLFTIKDSKQERLEKLNASKLAVLYAEKFSNRYFLRLAVSSGVLYGGMFAYFSESPDLFQNNFGVSAQNYSWIVAATVGAFVLGNVGVGPLRRRFKADEILNAAFLLCAMSAFALLLLSATTSAFSMLMAFFYAMFLLGTGAVMPLAISNTLQAFPKTAGTASSTMGFVHMGFGTVGSLAVIFLAAPLGSIALPVAMCGLSITAFVIFVLLRDPKDRLEGGSVPVDPPFYARQTLKPDRSAFTDTASR